MTTTELIKLLQKMDPIGTAPIIVHSRYPIFLSDGSIKKIEYKDDPHAGLCVWPKQSGPGAAVCRSSGILIGYI